MVVKGLSKTNESESFHSSNLIFESCTINGRSLYYIAFNR